MSDAPQGLRIETAASLIARDLIKDHLQKFAPVIRRDRAAGLSCATEYVNALAGVAALVIVGGHASKEEIIGVLTTRLREYIDRDLAHLGRGN